MYRTEEIAEAMVAQSRCNWIVLHSVAVSDMQVASTYGKGIA